MFNARSICNKMSGIVTFLTIQRPLFLSVSETWLKEDTLFHTNAVNCIGYEFTGINCQDKVGRVGVFIKHSITFNVLDSAVTPDIEYHVVELIVRNVNLCVCTIYRPPKGSIPVFFTSADNSLSTYAMQYKRSTENVKAPENLRNALSMLYTIIHTAPFQTWIQFDLQSR